MDDWQVNDLAICVQAGRIECLGGLCVHTGRTSPPKGAIRVVNAITVAIDRGGFPMMCGCLVLHFSDGSSGLSSRFRKIRPHEADEQDRETIALLTAREPVA